MAVYVDDMYRFPLGRLRRMNMSHMMADTHDELIAMADAIGVSRRWLQKAGRPDKHFDIALSNRAEAVRRGAIEISMKDMARLARDRREAVLAAQGRPPR